MKDAAAFLQIDFINIFLCHLSERKASISWMWWPRSLPLTLLTDSGRLCRRERERETWRQSERTSLLLYNAPHVNAQTGATSCMLNAGPTPTAQQQHFKLLHSFISSTMFLTMNNNKDSGCNF